MADKSISQLPEATQVNAADMFVLEQSSTAKKLTGQTLENWMLSYADGHGGIQSITKQSTAGLVDTYRITLADTTTIDFTVTNGKGVSGVTKQSTAGLVDTYRMTYTDGTYSAFTVTNGEKGDKGDQTYVWVKWTSTETPTSSDLSDYPEAYIGIYTGTASIAPTTPSLYRWYRYKGETGDRGDDAEVVEQKVEYAASADRTTPPSSGWSADFPVVHQGEFLWSRTTVRFNSGNDVVTYGVSYQGMDGSGAVSMVNYVEPVGGNIQLDALNIPTTDSNVQTELDSTVKSVNGFTPVGGALTLPAPTAIANGTYNTGGIIVDAILTNGQQDIYFTIPIPVQGKKVSISFTDIVSFRQSGSYLCPKTNHTATANTATEMNACTVTIDNISFYGFRVKVHASSGYWYKYNGTTKGDNNIIISAQVNLNVTVSD